MRSKMLVAYMRRPQAVHCSSEFINAVMKTFKGRKASTDVEKLVKSYIQNTKIGILIAVPFLNDAGIPTDRVDISYAQWNQYLDPYDQEIMLGVALERNSKFVNKPDTFEPKVPFEIERKLPDFMDRCRRYYKNCTFPKWTDKY